VALALYAADPITAEGVLSFLSSVPQQVSVLPEHREAEAEVLLLLADQVTDNLLARMRCRTSTPISCVLVANAISDAQLVRAIGHGLTGFLPRQQVTLQDVVDAVRSSRSGRTQLPNCSVDSLVEHFRRTQQNLSGAAVPWGLTEREVAVLRLLAEGMDTAEMAARLSYSERTIKHIIHGVITRLGVRNRTHAVAHAIRADVL
jgi:DNA-binding NarL/FixJ family response regulator